MSNTVGTTGFQRPISSLLRDLRRIRVACYHPYDEDGKALMSQLQRIGCHSVQRWPPESEMPAEMDIIIVTLKPEVSLPSWFYQSAELLPTLIAVVNYENPTMLDQMLRIHANALLAAPIKSFGLLSTLVLARQVKQQQVRLMQQTARISTKFKGAQDVERAKLILMQLHEISEKEAYALIRKRAMKERTTVEKISRYIVGAQATLSLS